VEVAHNVQGRWYTSTATLFGASPDGKAYLARLDQQAANGRKLVKIISSDAAQEDANEMWWPVTAKNGDSSPHKVAVQVGEYQGTDGFYAIAGEESNIAPLSTNLRLSRQLSVRKR
jgi:hypothetical protein